MNRAYTKAIHIRKNRDGKTVLFVSKFISTIDTFYGNYILI